MACFHNDITKIYEFGLTRATSCVPSNFMTNRRVPKFSLNNCAQSSKKTFMCPKFCTNPVLNYTKCHLSTNLSNFLKLCLLYCQKLFAFTPPNRRFAEKNRLSGKTGYKCHILLNLVSKCLEEPSLYSTSRGIISLNFLFFNIITKLS